MGELVISLGKRAWAKLLALTTASPPDDVAVEPPTVVEVTPRPREKPPTR